MIPELLQASHDSAGSEELLSLHGLHFMPRVMPWYWSSHYSRMMDHRQGRDPQPGLLRTILKDVVHYGLL